MLDQGSIAALTNHFDRAVRMQSHAFRHTPQQEPFDAMMAVRADHDQVCSGLLRFRENYGLGSVEQHRDRFGDLRKGP